MAEDKYANVFNAEVTLSAANTLTFAPLQFGIQLRDRIGIEIRELFYWYTDAALLEMTTAGDSLTWALTRSDQITDINDVGDDRIIDVHTMTRMDFGTAGSGQFQERPLKKSYNPPLLVLPTRLHFAARTAGLASAAVMRMRMHFTTVSISQDAILKELLETFELTT